MFEDTRKSDDRALCTTLYSFNEFCRLRINNSNVFTAEIHKGISIYSTFCMKRKHTCIWLYILQLQLMHVLLREHRQQETGQYNLPQSFVMSSSKKCSSCVKNFLSSLAVMLKRLLRSSNSWSQVSMAAGISNHVICTLYALRHMHTRVGGDEGGESQPSPPRIYILTKHVVTHLANKIRTKYEVQETRSTRYRCSA